MMKLFVLFLFFIGAAYLLVAFNYSYSDGNRAGYIQKFSNKGWICKTHEGELAMTTVPGVAPILWNFSVRDEKRGVTTLAGHGKTIGPALQRVSLPPDNLLRRNRLLCRSRRGR